MQTIDWRRVTMQLARACRRVHQRGRREDRGVESALLDVRFETTNEQMRRFEPSRSTLVVRIVTVISSDASVTV